MFGKTDVGDFENSLPSWISDHLGERSCMEYEVTQLPSSHREDPPSLKGSLLAALPPPTEKEANTMTQGELDRLRESCSFPSSILIKLLKVDKTIASTRSREVAFY